MRRQAVLLWMAGISGGAHTGCSSSGAPGGDKGIDGGGGSPVSSTDGQADSNASAGDTGRTSDGSGGTSDGGGPGDGGESEGGTVSAEAAPIGAPGGKCTVPAGAAAEDVSNPTTVVGDGTAASCTADKVVAAVAGGGVVTFDCGPDPLTIVVPEIEILNDGGVTKDGSVTLDGGGKITLSGGGKNRILRQNPCDESLHYTTTHCNNQDTPHLVVQNIGFAAGAGVADQVDDGGLLGGGALYVGGGTFKAVNVTVTDSQETNAKGQLVQDLAGGAIYTTNMSSPGVVYVVNSTFERNSGVNGGALGSIGTAWTLLNSVFTDNSATGHGENPARTGTEGGGLGGAIYNDGDDYTLTVCGSQFNDNQANELGSGSIFQVIDDLNGDLSIDQTTFTGNSDDGGVQEAAKHPGIFVEARDMGNGTSGVTITNSTFN